MGHYLSLAVLPDRIGSLVSGEYAQVAHDGFRYFQRLSVAAARDFLCQDEIDSVARKDKPGNRTLRGYRHSDGAHARAKRRCQETAISGLDQRTLGDGLPGRDGVATERSAARRVGKEGCSTGSSRWGPDH